MKKFLFHYGYFGTTFRRTQLCKTLGEKDISISKHLEDALLALFSIKDPTVYNSTPTEPGVHAICSTFHTELDLRRFRKKMSRKVSVECSITNGLNRYFKKSSLDIRIIHMKEVPSCFHCQHSAIRWTYLCRLAIYKFQGVPKDVDLYSEIPLPELNRCHVMSGNFDVEAVQSACDILKESHDYSCFLLPDQTSEDIYALKTLEKIEITPGQPLLDPRYDEKYEPFEFFDIVLSSKSVLYGKVQMMIGLLIAVGRGEVDLEFVRSILSNPDMKLGDKVHPAAASGCFLLKLDYPPACFLEESEDPNNESDKL